MVPLAKIVFALQEVVVVVVMVASVLGPSAALKLVVVLGVPPAPSL